MSLAYAATERSFRRAFGRHEFSESHLRVLDKILFYGVGRGRLKAWIPKQRIFAELCGLDKAEVSRILDWLERQSVIERGGPFYGLMPPQGWTVSVRVKETPVLLDLEDWLERVDPDQPELLPPPASLNDALREYFVESHASRAGPGNVESKPEPGRPAGQPGEGGRSRVEAASRWIGSKSSQVGESPTGGRVGEFTTREPKPGMASGAEVGDSPTTPSSSSTRLFDSRKEISSSRIEYSKGRDWLLDPYVREKLARNGKLSEELTTGTTPMAQHFGEVFGKKPGKARELLGMALTRDRPNAWLNRALRVELGIEAWPLTLKT